MLKSLLNIQHSSLNIIDLSYIYMYVSTYETNLLRDIGITTNVAAVCVLNIFDTLTHRKTS